MRSLLVLPGLALLVFACNGADVVLATIPATDGGEAPEHDERCLNDTECPTGKFCDKIGCGDSPGRCHHFPTVCDNTRSPVCGCDGITYFNDCLRKTAGTSIAENDECETNALECTPGSCPSGGFCARLVGTGFDKCGPTVAGRCWVLPPICPPGDPDHWDSCGDPGPTTLKCADTCAALRSELPSFRQTRCN